MFILIDRTKQKARLIFQRQLNRWLILKSLSNKILKTELLSKMKLKMKSIVQEDNSKTKKVEPQIQIEVAKHENRQSLPQISILDIENEENDRIFSLMNKRMSKFEKSKSRTKKLHEFSAKNSIQKLQLGSRIPHHKQKKSNVFK